MTTRKKVRSLLASYLAEVSLKVLRSTIGNGTHLFTDAQAREWCTSYKSRFMRLGSWEVHYRDEGTGPVLLLLHGFGASLHAWNEWVDLLKDRFRIVRMDLPGLGLSTPIRRKVSIDMYVEFLKDFLDALQIERCMVCGNSLGGWLAWEFCARYPERVEKMVLMNAAGYFQETGKPAGIELIAKEQFRKILRSGIPKVIIRNLARNSFGDKSKLTEDLVDRAYILSNREGMLASLIHIASSEATSNIERITQIDTPTLIMWGNLDHVIPVGHADFFYCDLNNCQLIVYKGVGHAPMLEIPAQSAEDLAHFLLEG